MFRFACRRAASLPLPPKSFEQQIARLVEPKTTAPKTVVSIPQPVIALPVEKQPAPERVVIAPKVSPKVVPTIVPESVPGPEQQMAAVEPKQLQPKFKSSIAPQQIEPKQVALKPVPKPISKPILKPVPPAKSAPTVQPAEPKIETVQPDPVIPEAPAPKKLAKKLDYAELVKQAKAGVASAQLALAQHYHTGQGVSLSNIKALFWFHQAAQQGVADAQLSLGMIYYVGDGIPRNQAKAYRWIKLAAAQNNAKAITIMKALHRSMPSPLFTSLVFPDPVILEPDPIVISSQTTQPYPQPIVNAVVTQNTVKKITVNKPTVQTAVTVSAAPKATKAPMVSPWKPDVFVLGNKPLP
jgi:hypothetical protein